MKPDAAKQPASPRRTLLLLVVGCLLTVCGSILIAGIIHDLLANGSCSTNGYSSQYGGPIRTCPKGTALISWLITPAMIFAIGGAAALPGPLASYTIGFLFAAVGVGALTDIPAAESSSRTFLWIFGGSFLAVGLGVEILFFVRQLTGRWARPFADIERSRRPAFIGAAVAAVAVSVAATLALLAVLSPGSKVERLSAASSSTSGTDTGFGPTSGAPPGVRPPGLRACQIVTAAIAQRTLGPDAHVTIDQGGPGSYECRYESASDSGYLLVFISSWTTIHSTQVDGEISVTGYGDEAYLSSYQYGFAVRKGTKGIRVIVDLGSNGPRAGAARDAADATQDKLIAQHAVPLL